MKKTCRICQEEFDIINPFGHSRQFCYICIPEGLNDVERTTVKRQSAKKQALKLLGGKCLKCGETKPYLIDFHHVNNKEHSFSELLADSKFEEYFQELEKAVPLCGNCHREFHYQEANNKLSIENYIDMKTFIFHKEDLDRNYTYTSAEKVEKNIKTDTPKPIIERKELQEFEIEDYDLLLEEIKNSSFTEVAIKYGVTPTAIQKRLKTRGYPHLIDDIKGIIRVKEEKVKTWRDLPITLIKDNEEHLFKTGNLAIDYITNQNPESKRDRVSEGLARLFSGQRASYLKYTIKR